MIALSPFLSGGFGNSVDAKRGSGFQTTFRETLHTLRESSLSDNHGADIDPTVSETVETPPPVESH